MKKIAFIIEAIALLLLTSSLACQFYFKGNAFDIYYAVSSCAGISLYLTATAIDRKNWGVIPIAVMFAVIALYFSIDFSFLDNLVETENSGIFIISTSFVCYVYSFIQRLRHKWTY